ncbi:hypothetical protein S7S_11425 [Isoalcanivorax pacificus W11-5]|uniref:Uncharacterized protein n=1 Tax=Isoalcanivorax pacificus W11-5 TaxID=391936 RepID=A0A0B4XR36_9GAMM|nr:hypothetical protein [Isoalcanivorax pacificus]AJD48697.1 hypothetical protein S7S_11425 [Isoalcanivorax pacificus W11-5]
MVDGSKALLPSDEVSWKRSQDSTVLDSKRLLQDQPDLLSQYGIPKPGSRRFLVQT